MQHNLLSKIIKNLLEATLPITGFLIFLMLIPNQNANAEMNQEINFSAMFGSIERKPNDDNSTQIDWSAEYSYFFSALDSEDTPFELREFIRHPSKLFVGTYAFDDFGSYLLNNNHYYLGGLYYFLPQTGIELQYRHPNNNDQISVMLNQYLGSSNRLSFTFARQKIETAWAEYHFNGYNISLSGYQTHKISLYYQISGGFENSSNTDAYNIHDKRYDFSVKFGLIGSKKALYLKVDYVNLTKDVEYYFNDWDRDAVRFELNPKYWINKNISLGLLFFAEFDKEKQVGRYYYYDLFSQEYINYQYPESERKIFGGGLNLTAQF